MSAQGSFWKDYARRYGQAALPPAGRKALGLPDEVGSEPGKRSATSSDEGG